MTASTATGADPTEGPADEPVTRPGRPEPVVVSLVLLVAASACSGSEVVSAVLAGLGLIAGAPVVWRNRSATVVRLALAIVGVWLVYGLLVGSLPPPTRLRGVRRWATTEGRVLVVVATMAVASGIPDRVTLRRLCRSVAALVTVIHLVALVPFLLKFGVPLFPIRINRLYAGLTSSHHVPGFLSAVVIVVVLSCPGWFTAWQRRGVVAVALVTIVLSSSRSALLGLLLGGLLIAARRLDRRRVLPAIVGVLLLGSLVVASNARFRTTLDVVTRREFPSEVWTAFSDGPGGLRGLSDSPAEANILIRIGLWGEAARGFADSPLIGIGAFRQNDPDREYRGIRHLVWLATDARRGFNDFEPHNVVLYLAHEFGLMGLALHGAPYVVAWRRCRVRPPRRDGDEDENDVEGDDDVPQIALLGRATILVAFGISMVSSGILATGLGLASSSVIFGAAAALAGRSAFGDQRSSSDAR